MSFERLNPSDYVGKTFHDMTVLSLMFAPDRKETYAVCLCKCGIIKPALPALLKKGAIKSCGCYRKRIASTRHHEGLFLEKNPNYLDGRSTHPLYGLWRRMMDRCYNPNSYRYDCYGGKGVTVCEEWHDFWNFVKWSDSVGGRPTKYTLDRIDSNGNYEPSNCRWADSKTQSRNKSSNRYLTFDGKTQTITDWADELGINGRTLNNRINRGWSVERALTERVHN
ncbi:MAG: hypothetical protein K6D96_01660 [Acetatifactor sp.]|nr:hypothetical protein [Acetatifactor sp.]